MEQAPTDPLSRRAVLAAVAALGPEAAHAGSADAPVEPRMRLAHPPSDLLTVALTFDACPGAFDERIASMLVESRTPATIFVTGLWMRRNPAGLALLLANRDLFAIENHGYWHIPPVLGSRRIFGIACAGTLATVRREVTAGAAVVQAAVGSAPRWYRAATGFYSPTAMDEIRRMGFGIAGYSLNADQGASLPARAVAARIAAAVSGAVIVAHINQPRRSSGLGVAAGVEALRRRGARFLRLDELSPSDVVYSQ
jgi:peptidoglycan/xylan/chitin deacetylase (PgdA/CDA1 family)